MYAIGYGCFVLHVCTHGSASQSNRKSERVRVKKAIAIASARVTSNGMYERLKSFGIQKQCDYILFYR